ncbi:hypothetical protein V1264_015990 [Littorina saxatilis]|uniref:C1q domain-containing protein n=1 Tax=Littorina saxatilis TaxID=31220 RepID=A0AAN9BN77_9CAEN
MKALSDKGQVENVSFHALMTKTPTYNSGHKIVFDQVKFTQGNGYNPADGVFTATVPGTYMFMTTVRTTTAMVTS